MEYSTRVISVKLGNGSIAKFEASALGDQQVASSQFALKNLLEPVASLAAELRSVIDDVKPRKASIKFGIEVAAESGHLTALIVKGTGKGNLEITLEWGT